MINAQSKTHWKSFSILELGGKERKLLQLRKTRTSCQLTGDVASIRITTAGDNPKHIVIDIVNYIQANLSAVLLRSTKILFRLKIQKRKAGALSARRRALS